MNRRELVKDTIARKTTARVPYCIDFTPEGEKRLQEAIGLRSVGNFVDNDVAQINIPWSVWAELGPEWKAPEPPPGTPPARGYGSYEFFFESAKRLRDNSDKYILVPLYGIHYEKAGAARGAENFLVDLVAHPKAARRLLDRIIEQNLVMLENVLCAPEIDGVLFGSDWGSQRGLLMSPGVWQETIRPGEQRMYDLAHGYGKDVWVHSCGNIEQLIPSLIELKLDVLNPVQPEAMDIARLKADYGRQLTFWGGISTQRVLPFGTPGEVKQEARRVRELMSANGGYIFGPSQMLQGDVPAENMVALIEAAKEQ